MKSPRLQTLFEDVQLQQVFPDGKTFVDCLPKIPESEIADRYEQEKKLAGFNLKQFVLDHYDPPVPHSDSYQSDRNKTVTENIEALWEVLTRQPEPPKGSLIALRYPYIVPGGRFGEIYYWDSYFTMLGLKVSGRTEMISHMVKNFADLIDKIGYIPNGNRTYYFGRSQPPFFFRMVRLLTDINGEQVLPAYRHTMEKEYQFWMKGAETLSTHTTAAFRTVRMPGAEILNRYWDMHASPRPESYREDVELSERAEQEPALLFRHLRAGAESGWDFSSRWLKDQRSLESIHTTDIVPVDLNCFLYELESTLAEAFALNDPVASARYKLLAEKRKKAIHTYCWNEELGFFMDFDLITGNQKQVLSLAGLAPLFAGIASPAAAVRVRTVVREKFLQPGGVVTTVEQTGQQWDAPNGWAPLHWMTITGLENYGFSDLAKDIALRWTGLNEDVFKRTGRLMEKYNVIDTHLEAGGGEYEGQDGFGWTNGVYLALKAKYTTID